MLIVHMSGTYVQPHKHLEKCESFHIIEGRLRVLLFDNNGKHIRSISMSDLSGGEIFFYRLETDVFHSVVPETEFVVFHEVTSGPFFRDQTISASWAPQESDTKRGSEFISKFLNP